jgi:hypothetical protein
MIEKIVNILNMNQGEQMKRFKVFKYISNISFGIGLVIGIYAIVRVYTAGANLPAGVCPVDNGRPFIIAAIVFLVVSLVFSFLTSPKKRAKAAQKDADKPSQ